MPLTIIIYIHPYAWAIGYGYVYIHVQIHRLGYMPVNHFNGCIRLIQRHLWCSVLCTPKLSHTGCVSLIWAYKGGAWTTGGVHVVIVRLLHRLGIIRGPNEYRESRHGKCLYTYLYNIVYNATLVCAFNMSISCDPTPCMGYRGV